MNTNKFAYQQAILDSGLRKARSRHLKEESRKRRIKLDEWLFMHFLAFSKMNHRHTFLLRAASVLLLEFLLAPSLVQADDRLPNFETRRSGPATRPTQTQTNAKGSEMTNGVYRLNYFRRASPALRAALAAVRQCPIASRSAIQRHVIPGTASGWSPAAA